MGSPGATASPVPTAPTDAPPDPDAPLDLPGLSYIPALDGVRAFAVLGVMAFHGGIPWMNGGYLGVDTFFVLSGFLITSLLIGEWGRTKTIRLGAFWARRARRLLPALVAMLLFVAFYAAVIVPRGTYPTLRLDALSTLLYVANWHFILVGSSYFNQTGLPSPLTHTWSLAIEEQFYLVWPLVVLGVMKWLKSLRALLVISVGGAVASAMAMALLYDPNTDPTRLYYGTDTHAQCILVGASLAVALTLFAQRRMARQPPLVHGHLPGGDPGWAARTNAGRVWLTLLGCVGIAVTAVMWARFQYSDALLWRGGFLLAALATAAVLLSSVCAQGSLVAKGLSVAPLRFVGRISYGMYLWHFPLFIWIDGARTGLVGYQLFAVRLLATAVVATVSFYLLERPIRRGTFFRDWRAWVATPIAAVATIVVLVLATTVPAVAEVKPVTPQPATARPKINVLVVGDSVALTLGIGIDAASLQKAFNFDEENKAEVGCGVAVGTLHRFKDQVGSSGASCQPNPSPGTQQWPQEWGGWISQYHPNVVVVLVGRWEVVDRTYHGQWTNILNPTYAAYVKQQLQLAVNVATSQGAGVVLMTAPCYDSGEQPNGQPWPEDSPARLNAYNDLVKQVVADNPGKATLFNLDALVCPGGRFEEYQGGVQIRNGDGIHFTWTGGIYLGPRIWPTIVGAARSLSPAGNRQSATGVTGPSTTAVPSTSAQATR